MTTSDMTTQQTVSFETVPSLLIHVKGRGAGRIVYEIVDGVIKIIEIIIDHRYWEKKMKMNHFIVEGYCEENEECTSCKGMYSMGVHCFNCKSFSYTSVEDEMLFVNEHGESEEMVGFGGEMEPSDYSKREKCVEMWKNICKNKINEAYDEYMRMLEHEEI